VCGFFLVVLCDDERVVCVDFLMIVCVCVMMMRELCGFFDEFCRPGPCWAGCGTSQRQ